MDDRRLTKADLKTELAAFERRLTRRVAAMIAAWVVVLAALELALR